MTEPRNILISGCSGGGKSTLLEAISRLGYATVPEPGRRIVAEELRQNGQALPWVNLHAFAERAIRMARSDLSASETAEGFVFFDRGLVDAAVALEFAGGPQYRALLAGKRHYARRVFLAPPWPEIYVTDPGRRHGLDAAQAEYQRLLRAFSELGYDTCELPKSPLEDRVNFVLGSLGIG